MRLILLLRPGSSVIAAANSCELDTTDGRKEPRVDFYAVRCGIDFLLSVCDYGHVHVRVSLRRDEMWHHP